MNVIFILLTTLIPVLLFLLILKVIADKFFSDSKFNEVYKNNLSAIMMVVCLFVALFTYSTLNSVGFRNELPETSIPAAPKASYKSDAIEESDLIEQKDKWSDLSEKMKVYEARQNEDINGNEK